MVQKIDMENIKTFKDLESEKISEKQALILFNELYEKITSLEGKEEKFIRESASGECPGNADGIAEMLEKASNEGLVGGLVGGIGGLAFGSKIGAAICKALGITQGPLYSLMTSKIMTTAICTYLGIKA